MKPAAHRPPPRRPGLVPILCCAGACTIGGLIAGESGPDPLHEVSPLPDDLDLGPGTILESADPQMVNGVLYITRGFFLHLADDFTLIGDALRWDQERNVLYATGRVVLAGGEGMGIRIAADRLGLRRLPVDPETGQALRDGEPVGRNPWVVEAWNTRVRLKVPAADGERMLRLAAAHLRMLPDRLVLDGVRGDGGHGAMLGFHTPLLTIRLKDRPDQKRKGLKREAADIFVSNPNLRLWNVPFFWLPFIYRDFRLNYPWTRFEFGRDSRLGPYVHGWIGFDLPSGCPCADADKRDALENYLRLLTQRRRVERNPELTPEQKEIALAILPLPELPGEPTDYLNRWYHLHGRVELRADEHLRAGAGYGARLRWEHHQFGEGEALWYGIPVERVYAPRNMLRAFLEGPATPGRMLGSMVYTADEDRPWLTTRSAHVLDVEHRLSFPGGAAYGRWVDIPDADPITPDLLDPFRLYAPPEKRAPSERFRADFLREDLSTRPLARRGLSLAWSAPLVSVVADTEYKHHPWLVETERELGLQASLPPLHLIGPLHLGGEGWAERLRREEPDYRYVDATWTHTSADRLTYDAYLTATHWLGGLGLDATGGVRGLYYDDGLVTDHERQGGIDPVFGAFDRWYDPVLEGTRPQSEMGLIRETDRTFVDDQYRFVPYWNGGVRLRLEGVYGEGETAYTHVISPRLGVEIHDELHGERDEEGWYDFNFHDRRDRLEHDRQYLTAGLNTSLSYRKRSLVSIDLDSRWALRSEELSYQRELEPTEEALLGLTRNAFRRNVADFLGGFQPAGWSDDLADLYRDEFARRFTDPQLAAVSEVYRSARAPGRLIDVDGDIAVNPSRTFNLNGSFTYNAVREHFTSLTFSGLAIPHERVRFTCATVWLPPREEPNQTKEIVNDYLTDIDPLLAIDTTDRIDEDWQHTLGTRLHGNRYTLRTEVILRPRGAPVDGWLIGVQRKLVDGTIGLTYELLRDENGRISDQDIGLQVSLYGFDIYD